MSESLRIGRRTVELTRPDKVLFPGDGIAKRDLAAYYAAVATTMLTHVRGRALTMERFPDGIEGHRLFQKNAPDYFPGWIERVTVPKAKGTVTHPVATEAAVLVYLANQACITPHAALATAATPYQPDQVIFDLDPSGPDVEPVRRTALELHELLSELGLEPFCKTSGSKGFHVMVPVKPQLGFDETYAFARAVAGILVARHPKDLTFEFHKAERKGRIYMDVGRNAWAQTAAAPYAVRARPGAPVATPLGWDEVPRARPDGFTIADVPARLAQQGDPWKGWRGKARALGPALEALRVA